MFNGLYYTLLYYFWDYPINPRPSANCCFFLFRCFAEKEYQTDSKWNETFGNVIFGTNVIQRTWSPRKAINEESTRQGGPTLLHRHTSSSYIYLRTPKPSESEPKPYFHRRNLLYREIPSLGLFRRSAGGGGIDHGGLLHQHHSLSMMCQ